MATKRTISTTTSVGPRLADLERGWTLSLQAEGKSAKTMRTYVEALHLFDSFLADAGMPQAVAAIAREHVEAFVVHEIKRTSVASANVRYRALQQFFRWVVEDGEITTSPMQRMHPPKLVETPPPVFTEDELGRLVRACDGQRFEDRRDAAVVRLLLDTGIRRAELAGLRVNDVDLTVREAVVTGKGRRTRAVRFGFKTAASLEKYLRLRSRRPDASLDALWLGQDGPMTDSGLVQVVRRRAKIAGVDDPHLHRFRHTFAHQWMANGGNEGDLMQVAGWRSRTMTSRYGASAAAERARDAADRLRIGDRL